MTKWLLICQMSTEHDLRQRPPFDYLFLYALFHFWRDCHPTGPRCFLVSRIGIIQQEKYITDNTTKTNNLHYARNKISDWYRTHIKFQEQTYTSMCLFRFMMESLMLFVKCHGIVILPFKSSQELLTNDWSCSILLWMVGGNMGLSNYLLIIMSLQVDILSNWVPC